MKTDNFIESSLRQEQEIQNLTDKEFDMIFGKIQKEISISGKEPFKTRFKIPASLLEFMQVAAVIAVLALVPVLTLKYNSSLEKSQLAVPQTTVQPGEDNRNVSDGEEAGKLNSKIVISDTYLFSSPDTSSPMTKKVKAGQLIFAEKSEKDKNGFNWFYVYDPIDSSSLKKGWIPEGKCINFLASLRAADSGIKYEEVKALVENYFRSLMGQEVTSDKKLKNFVIKNLSIDSIAFAGEGGTSLPVWIEYNVQPYDVKNYKAEAGSTVDEDGWIRALHSIAEVSTLKLQSEKNGTGMEPLLYVLHDLTPEPASFNNPELFNLQDILTRQVLDNNGFIMVINSGAGGKIRLPDKIQEAAEDRDNLNLYLAYCLELSKAQGMDFSKYCGKEVTLSGGAAVKMAKPEEYYNFVVLSFEGEVCGAWVEKTGYGTQPSVDIQTFDGKSFNSIVRDKAQWLKQNGFTVQENKLEDILNENALNNKNPLIYKMLDTNPIGVK